MSSILDIDMGIITDVLFKLVKEEVEEEKPKEEWKKMTLNFSHQKIQHGPL